MNKIKIINAIKGVFSSLGAKTSDSNYAVALLDKTSAEPKGMMDFANLASVLGVNNKIRTIVLLWPEGSTDTGINLARSSEYVILFRSFYSNTDSAAQGYLIHLFTGRDSNYSIVAQQNIQTYKGAGDSLAAPVFSLSSSKTIVIDNPYGDVQITVIG